jgi:hypothetical protein
MNTKERIFNTIKSSIQANNLSIYSLAKTTGINRSTLQKALSGTRPLNVRQFELLLDAVPLTPKENKYLYDNFIEMSVGKERLSINKAILAILSSVSDCLENDTEFISIAPPNIENINSVYSGNSVSDVVSFLVNSEIDRHDTPHIYTYFPLYNDFFASLIAKYVDSSPKPTEVSVLFEFMKQSGFGTEKNFTTLKNIMPLILNKHNHYNLHYSYVNSFLYDDHITIYPYYIILSDRAILLSHDLQQSAIVSDKSIVESMIKAHSDRLLSTSVMQTEVPGFFDTVRYLIDNHIHSGNMYTISYEPFILSYIPPEMYDELVIDDLPDRQRFLSLIYKRIEQISDVPITYMLFNKDSLTEFLQNGRIGAFHSRHLKPCSPEQRKVVLEKMIRDIENGKLVLRAFSSDKINVSKNFKITYIKGHHCLQIVMYPDNDNCRLIDIGEPVISKDFINFFNDMLDSSYTYTSEETLKLLNNCVNKLTIIINKACS